jgi:hypothetical protein
MVACAQIVAPTQEKFGGRRRPNRERTILSADSFQINRPKTTQTLGVFRNHKFVVEPPVRIPLVSVIGLVSASRVCKNALELGSAVDR